MPNLRGGDRASQCCLRSVGTAALGCPAARKYRAAASGETCRRHDDVAGRKRGYAFSTSRSLHQGIHRSRDTREAWIWTQRICGVDGRKNFGKGPWCEIQWRSAYLLAFSLCGFDLRPTSALRRSNPPAGAGRHGSLLGRGDDTWVSALSLYPGPTRSLSSGDPGPSSGRHRTSSCRSLCVCHSESYKRRADGLNFLAQAIVLFLQQPHDTTHVRH